MVFWYILGGIAVLLLIGRLNIWYEKSQQAAAKKKEIEEDNRVIEEVLCSFDIQEESEEIKELILQGKSKITGGS